MRQTFITDILFVGCSFAAQNYSQGAGADPGIAEKGVEGHHHPRGGWVEGVQRKEGIP